MEIFMIISNMIIPVVILGVVCFGVSRRVQVYDAFIEGANSGFHIVVKIMPTMVALMIAVGILRASGFLDMLASQLGRMTDYIGFPGFISSKYCSTVMISQLHFPLRTAASCQMESHPGCHTDLCELRLEW